MRKNHPFRCSILLLPILVDGNHWILAVIRTSEKAIELYDPTGLDRPSVGSVLRNWIGAYFCNPWEWDVLSFHEKESLLGRDIAKQQNHIDCGVYVCKAAEAICLVAPVNFCAEDIPHVRRRMIVELINGKATNLHPTRL